APLDGRTALDESVARMVAGLVRALSRYGWHVEVTADEPGAAGARGNVPPPRPSAAPETPRPTTAPPRPTSAPDPSGPTAASEENRPAAGSAPRPGPRSSNAPGA
ncbi:hypothetical protein ABZ726_22300, partial [Streptomyces hundungensis]